MGRDVGLRALGPVGRSILIATIAFSTVVDLFATQAIIPALTTHYGVSPAAMGAAVNACTLGMAVASLAVALFSARIDRRVGIVGSLLVLVVPTALLALAPDLITFALLRVAQGLCMATAFSLTLAYLGEETSGGDTASAFAAYITGNVASNLIGRLIASGVTGAFGTEANFLVFAGLNALGAALVAVVIRSSARPAASASRPGGLLAGAIGHLRNRALLAAFAIGFCILFIFVGVFTYVNFLLAGPPIALGMAEIGLVYAIFLPSVLSTPFAGVLVTRIGVRPALLTGLGLAAVGVALLLAPQLAVILTGMGLVAVGTFFAQAVATGFVGRTAATDRAAASGLYLASYFSGGLIGSIGLGLAFDAGGWSAVIAGVGGALALAMALVAGLRDRSAGGR